jgi:acyl-CoA synthetase (AMP-forming)/AMP-acid ligase II
MPDWVQRALLEKLPKLKLTQIYGQSEVGVLTALRHWYLPQKLSSIGRQAYNVDVAVVDPEGNRVQPGEIGEIVSRGENVMLEYYNEPEQTKAFFRHGWGWTGDVGTFDEAGFITLVDRSKDMIISGGENVYPKEIENVIYELPAVAECAVFGIPDDKWGEVPAAYVLLKSGAALSEEVLVEHCARHLARFKRPRLVKFVTEFPKTPIGKIQKNVLREPYWKDREKKI